MRKGTFTERLMFRIIATIIAIPLAFIIVFINQQTSITYAEKYNSSYKINEDGSANITENIIINTKTDNYVFNYFIPHNSNEGIKYLNIAWREFGESNFTTYSHLDNSKNKVGITKFPDGTRICFNNKMPKGKIIINLDYEFTNYVYLYKDTALLKRTLLTNELF